MNKYRQTIRKKEVLPYFIVFTVFLTIIFTGALVSYLFFYTGCGNGSDLIRITEDNSSSSQSLSAGLCMPRERDSVLSYAVTPRSAEYLTENETLNTFLSIFNYTLLINWVIVFFSFSFGVAKLIYVANKTPKY